LLLKKNGNNVLQWSMVTLRVNWMYTCCRGIVVVAESKIKIKWNTNLYNHNLTQVN